MSGLGKHLAILLVIVMVFTVAPATVFAADTSPPVFSDFTIDKTTARPGDILNFSVKIEDESEITSAVTYFMSPNGYSYPTTSFELDSGSIYRGTFTVPQNALNGQWKVSIGAYDSQGNNGGFSRENALTVIGGSNDIDPPEFSDFIISQTTAQPGDILNFSIKIEDESEVASAVTYFISPTGYAYPTTSFELDSGSIYRGTFTVPQNALNGQWKVSIGAYDSQGNNGGFSGENALTVIGGSNDFDPPEFSDFTISKTKAQPGDILNFSIKIDDESEITSAVTYFISPTGYAYSTTSFELDSDNIYRGTFTIPQNASEGRWKVSIGAYDALGNNGGFSKDDAFTVIVSDEQGPAISEITTSPSQLKPGESLKVKAKLTDPSGVNRITATLNGPNGQSLNGSMSPVTGETDYYEADFTLPAGAAYGNWSIAISAYDGYNNTNSKTVGNAFSVLSVPVTAVNITPDKLSMNKGDSISLSANILPSDATIKSLIWKSSDTPIASVSAAGKVTALSPGTASITATSNDGGSIVSNTCIITVKPSAVLGETAKPTVKLHTANKVVYVKKGGSVTLPVLAYVDGKTTSKLTWKSSNKRVATVTKKGKVKAKKTGTAKITVKYKDGSKLIITIKIVSKSKKIKSISIRKPPKTIKAGAVKYLSVTIKSKTSTSVIPRWSSSNSKIISVDKAGRIVAQKKGKAKITVKSGGKKKTVTIRVI